MAERLEKVKSFEELRTGMIVVAMACGGCGRARCRSILLYTEECDDGSQGWVSLPDCNEDTAIGHKAVSDGRLYRVVDGLEAPAATTRAKRPAPASR